MVCSTEREKKEKEKKEKREKGKRKEERKKTQGRRRKRLALSGVGAPPEAKLRRYFLEGYDLCYAWLRCETFGTSFVNPSDPGHPDRPPPDRIV